ncbi:MAG: hypothetical protein FJX75_22835 [Armatimonadetes bacterium]|nr:hypothetical protein [Armatimonadota bacterium]
MKAGWNGIAALALLLAAGAGAQVPNSFETEDSLALVSPSGVTAERVQEHATDGKWALRVLFPGNEKDTWPGIGLTFDPPITGKQALQLDVYNPMDVPVSLSWRIDIVGQAEGVFGGATIQPKKTEAVEIGLPATGPVKHIYPYVRMPREDRVLVFDNLRWFVLKDYFTALRYVDDTPPPVPTKEESGRGFITFQRPFTDVVFVNTIPRADERVNEVGVFATPGEYEPATIALYALQDLSQVKVTFSGLPATGEVLPIRCLDKRVVYSSREYIAGMPVLCERRETVDIAKGESKRFVIDLRVNEDAKPGIHEGELHIQVGRGERATLPFRLRVLPYRLIEPTGMFWGEYYQGPKFSTDESSWSAALRRDMTDMREHGMTSVGLCFGPSVDNVTFAADGACALNFDGTSHYEQFMDLYKELGYPAPVILLSDSGQTAASKDDTAYTSDAWAQRYKAFWTAMQAEHMRRGWAEVIVQPVDEPGWQSQEEKDRNVRCLKLLKEIPGLRTEQDGPGDNYFHNVAGPFADVWNYNGALAEPYADALKAGHTVLVYNCDVESYRPEVDRYTAGWFQVTSGTQGCYNWAYISFPAKPYDDQSNKTGTWMHVYPPLGDEPGGPSTGWIGAREGVDDYRYVATLRQAIGRAEGRKLRAAQEAQREIEAITSSLDYSRAVRGRAQWTQVGLQPDGTKTLGGTLKLPNGWEHAEYDKRRWQVARATLGVMGPLGEIPAEPKVTLKPKPALQFATDVAWSARPPTKPTAGGSVGRALSIPLWNGAPTIDGDVTDAIWKQARKLDPFTLVSGTGRPNQPTGVLVGCDGKILYLAATCHEDNVAHLTATVTQDGGPVWQDDCIEVFVDATLSKTGYRQIMVNSLGKQGWNDSKGGKWRAQSEAAAKVGTDAWTVELAVPLADLGITGPFGFNVCRERRPMETLELSCWSPTGEAFGVPERFGVATLGGAWIGEVRLPPAILGRNEFTVKLINETDQERALRTELRMPPWRGAMRCVAFEALNLAPRSTVERTYAYDVTRAEPFTMTFVVIDAVGGKALAERTLAPTVLPPLTLTVGPRMYYLSEAGGVAEVGLSISEALRKEATLSLRLTNEGSKRALRSGALPEVAGDIATVRLDLGGVPRGTYAVRARLADRNGKMLAEAETRIDRIKGPFD